MHLRVFPHIACTYKYNTPTSMLDPGGRFADYETRVAADLGPECDFYRGKGPARPWRGGVAD